MLQTRKRLIRPVGGGRVRLRILTVIKELGFPCKVQCVPYVDTVGLFFRCLPKGMLKKLRSLLSSRQVRLNKLRYGRIVFLHQPTEESLLVAEQYRVKAGGKIYRVDFSYDLYCSDLHFNLENFIRKNVALKFQVRQPIHFEAEKVKGRRVNNISNVDQLNATTSSTMYWRCFPTTTVRNLLHYNDCEGKVDGGRPEHLELRLAPVKNCRAAGLVTLHDVIDANPRSIFERHVEIIKYDFESVKNALVRKAVQQDLDKHLIAYRPIPSTLSEGFADWHRSRLKRHVSSLIVRTEMQFAQTAKRHPASSDKVKKMSRYPSSIFVIPEKLRWGAKPLASSKYKKKIDLHGD